MSEHEVIAETKYLNLYHHDGWVYASRPKGIGAVAVIAVTDDSEILLVEQNRIPTGSSVIELPAGLVGDLPGEENDSMLLAAQRELLEETGFEAQSWKQLPTVCSSAGLTDEKATLFLATGLSKTGEGGGVDSEAITVHVVPIKGLHEWLIQSLKNGKDVDARVFSSFHFWQLHLSSAS